MTGTLILGKKSRKGKQEWAIQRQTILAKRKESLKQNTKKINNINPTKHLLMNPGARKGKQFLLFLISHAVRYWQVNKSGQWYKADNIYLGDSLLFQNWIGYDNQQKAEKSNTTYNSRRKISISVLHLFFNPFLLISLCYVLYVFC